MFVEGYQKATKFKLNFYWSILLWSTLKKPCRKHVSYISLLWFSIFLNVAEYMFLVTSAMSCIIRYLGFYQKKLRYLYKKETSIFLVENCFHRFVLSYAYLLLHQIFVFYIYIYIKERACASIEVFQRKLR